MKKQIIEILKFGILPSYGQTISTNDKNVYMYKSNCPPDCPHTNKQLQLLLKYITVY